MSNDSRVVDALQDESSLERVLQALGCDTQAEDGRGFRNGATIHCPSPDHPDVHPSCTVRGRQGLLHCQSSCGTILPLDLVVAHGRATDRAGAAKFVEEVLNLPPASRPAGPPTPVVDDPSLTVAQYLAMRGLPSWIADRFQLEDVTTWHAGADKGTRHCSYPSGDYSAVLMPNRPGRRPRVRSDQPGAKLRWAARVRHAGGRIENYSRDAADNSLEVPQDAIGVAQIEPASIQAAAAIPVAGPRHLLLVVEGESDTHALHAMGLPCVVGVPGAKMSRQRHVAPALLEACLTAAGGDTDLSSLAVIVWQEPGSAGSQFPAHVAESIAEQCALASFTPPVFAALPYSLLPGSPKDPAMLLMDRLPEGARAAMLAAVNRVILAAGPAASIGASPARAAALQAPLEVLQPGGAATPPPATAPAGAPPSAPDGAPSAASPQPPSFMVDDRPRRGAPSAEWLAFDELEDPPARDTSPLTVEGLAARFVRTEIGWSAEKIDKDGDAQLVPICSAFVVEQVERCSGEILVRIAAPFGGAWNRHRLEMATTADAGRTCAALAKVGVSVANRQRPSVTDLLLALVTRRESEVGAVHVPAGTGWSGRPGESLFGGIEVEPVNDFGARMYQANVRRRERRPDAAAAAREWWDDGALPLLSVPVGPATDSGLHPSAAAPLLALGAAAAAPLVGPLAEAGVAVAPVVWIAGLGGGGKSVTQKLAASIFAPSLPDLDGQSAFFANANISQAALSARVDSCRDLPLILDDVTQLPPLPGSTSRGDAARIEAAAALGMMVFNRKPIERATREGGIRQTRAFRSSAIFSAEVSMSSEATRAVVTAGHRRRISTIEARPMTERGLGQVYAERVNALSQDVGGSAGDLLVAQVRDLVSRRGLRAAFDQVRRRIAAMPEAAEVTLTQRESLAVSVLGYALLARAAGGVPIEESLDMATEMLAPYLSAGAGAGGATRDSDLSGVDAALRNIDDLMASDPLRFEHYLRDEDGHMVPPPMAGYFGKEIRPLHDGTRRVVMLRVGMEKMQTRYGVTAQVIEQAVSEGRCTPRKQVRMSDGKRAYGVLWMLPPSDCSTDDPDDDPTAPGPHDPDPHGLGSHPDREDSGPVVPDLVPISPNGTTTEESEVNDTMMTLEMHADFMAAGDFFERPITWMDGDEKMDARFAWGSGLYRVEHESMVTNQSLHETIRRDARSELESLRMVYHSRDELDVVVKDMPPDDDPNWQKIDALGQEAARSQWHRCEAAMRKAVATTDPDEKNVHHGAHVRHYRIHLMCRVRHPEWFIEVIGG